MKRYAMFCGHVDLIKQYLTELGHDNRYKNDIEVRVNAKDIL